MAEKKSKYDSLKLQNQVCFPLYACSKELVRQYSPHLKKLDLTYTQYVVMMVMWEKETVSSRELADSTHLDYGTLTPVLKRLEKVGYITRKRSPEDERLLILTLTDAGRKLKDKAVNIPSCMAKCMGLTMDEFKQLYLLTYMALKNMENNETEEESDE
ncbi:MAG: MarR family transcriptional regulator [Lachnospiraceae bacterium]|nr:MarR family transcriptional regulator [Lachnospiraceae bacterium]